MKEKHQLFAFLAGCYLVLLLATNYDTYQWAYERGVEEGIRIPIVPLFNPTPKPLPRFTMKPVPEPEPHFKVVVVKDCDFSRLAGTKIVTQEQLNTIYVCESPPMPMQTIDPMTQVLINLLPTRSYDTDGYLPFTAGPALP